MIKKIALPVFLLFLISTACVDYEIQSERTDSKIIIDGNDEDWQGKLQFFADEQFAIGFQHDDENIYMCITTNDKNRARRFLMPGMNIWFDTGSDKIYAVRFPLLDADKTQRRSNPGNEEQDERNNIFRDILAEQQMFLLVNDDDYPLGSYPVDGNSGIKLKAGMTKDKFVFELQYALISYNDKVINTLNLEGKDELVVKFESIEFKNSFAEGRPGGGGRGSGMPGGTGGERPGGMSGGPGTKGGRGPGKDKQSMEDIDFSVKVVFTD